MTADALVRPVGTDRAIFTRVLPVRRLPPGTYVLRANTLTTPFVIPAPLEAGAAEVFLPVSDESLSGPFGPADPSIPGDERADVWRRVDGLMRNRQFGAARELLEASAAKWPEGAGFAKPLALLLATHGRAADAVRMLQRHLAAQPGDVASLGMAVEWLYTLDAAGAAVESPAADLGLARAYAEAYQKMNGPEIPLVQLWLEHIARP
jgi:hypothetical protein